MPEFQTKVNTSSEQFLQNKKDMLRLVQKTEDLLKRAKESIR